MAAARETEEELVMDRAGARGIVQTGRRDLAGEGPEPAGRGKSLERLNQCAMFMCKENVHLQ